MRLLISAGEASGDLHAGSLLAELRRQAAPETVECFGLGGERLRAAGCDTVIDAREVAVLGLVEVLSHLPRIWGAYRRLLDAIDRRRPDVAVLVDFPEFNFRLARQLHRRGIPVVYYISPQLWAWRRGRVKLVQRYVRRMLVIFPFESEFYEQHGVEARFVGHPLAGSYAQELPQAERDVRQIALLPGSRRKEIELNLPAMLGAAQLLRDRHPELRFRLPVASTVSRSWLEALVREDAAVAMPEQDLEFDDDARRVLATSQAAIVASGTATLEAALAGTPFVMVYSLAPLTWLLGRRLVNVAFFCIVNLIAGEAVVPELVQHDFTPEKVAAHLEPLLADAPERRQMIDAFVRMAAKLHGPGHSAAEQAAREVLEVFRAGSTGAPTSR